MGHIARGMNALAALRMILLIGCLQLLLTEAESYDLSGVDPLAEQAAAAWTAAAPGSEPPLNQQPGSDGTNEITIDSTTSSTADPFSLQWHLSSSTNRSWPCQCFSPSDNIVSRVADKMQLGLKKHFDTRGYIFVVTPAATDATYPCKHVSTMHKQVSALDAQRCLHCALQPM